MIFTFLFFMPTTLRKIMKVLTCVTVGDKNYIKDSLVLECYTYDYFLYNFCISLPAVLYWTLFTPLFFLYQLISRRKKLRTLKMQIKYGYLYNEYKLFYWEFVKIYQKIFLIMVVEIFDSESDINIQIFFFKCKILEKKVFLVSAIKKNFRSKFFYCFLYKLIKKKIISRK